MSRRRKETEFDKIVAVLKAVSGGETLTAEQRQDATRILLKMGVNLLDGKKTPADAG